MNDTEFDAAPAGDFAERLIDGFFRRWYAYVLPVVVFSLLGVYSASQIVGFHTSVGRLNATANPFVDQPDIRGTEVGYYETPASATARLINEQLATDAFIDDVAERAGLAGLLDSGLITRADVRSNIGANAEGNNNLTVSASWSDSQTAYRLAESTIAGYSDYLLGLAAADTAEAVQFWTQRKAAATAEVDAASEQLSQYLAGLPEATSGTERTPEQLFEIERLNSVVDRALDVEREAQNAIDEASFISAQALSKSARELLVIDPPALSLAPSPVLRDQVVAFSMFLLLGVMVSSAALVMITLLDRTVRSASQLGIAGDVKTVVQVPRLKELAKSKKRTVPEESAA